MRLHARQGLLERLRQRLSRRQFGQQQLRFDRVTVLARQACVARLRGRFDQCLRVARAPRTQQQAAEVELRSRQAQYDRATSDSELDMVLAGVSVRIGSDNICDIFMPNGDGSVRSEIWVAATALRFYHTMVWAKIACAVPPNEGDKEWIRQALQRANDTWTTLRKNLAHTVSNGGNGIHSVDRDHFAVVR